MKSYFLCKGKKAIIIFFNIHDYIIIISISISNENKTVCIYYPNHERIVFHHQIIIKFRQRPLDKLQY